MNKFIYTTSILLLSTHVYSADDCSYGIDSTNKSAIGKFGVSYNSRSNKGYSYGIESSLSGATNTIQVGEEIGVVLNTSNMPSNAKPNYLWKDFCSGKIQSTNSNCTKINLTVLNSDKKECLLQVEIQDGLGNMKLDEFSYTVNKKDDENNKSTINFDSSERKVKEGGSIIFKLGFDKLVDISRTISLTSSTSDLTISPRTITIPANSSAKQTVTLTAQDDNDVNGNRTATITATSSNASAPTTATITIVDNDKENENIDALTPKLGLTLSKTSIIENDTVNLILTVDKPLEKAINVKIYSSDGQLEIDNAHAPSTIYLAKGATKSKIMRVRMPGDRVLNDLRTVTIRASTESLTTNTPSVKLKIYEDSGSSEKEGKDISLLSGYSLGNVYITKDETTTKYVTMEVTNKSNQNKSVKVKIVRQEGQANVLFDKEASCSIYVPAGRTKSCNVRLRFDEDAPTGNHSLKIMGSASGGSYFVEYKTISVVNQLKKRNYTVQNRVKSLITRKLNSILDYGNPVISSHGHGDCVHQLPYKFYLKHVPTNQITTVSQGNVDVCGNSVILDKQSSVRLSKSGVYKFWAQIYPPAGADSHAADNKTSEMTITVGDDKKPDLSIGSLAFPRHVKQNTNTSVSVRVSNIGAKASTSTRVGVYLSNNSSNGGKTGLSDKPLAVFNVPVIAANASKPFTKNDIKFSQTGQKYIYACVTEIKDEKSTVNNCSASKPITITEAKKYPDLLAISPVISGTPKVGQTLNIKMTVKNIGGKASPTTNIGFYTSANSTKDINDKRLTLSSISALSAGSSKVISGQVKFPKAGDLWVFSCVNFVSDEQNRDNNCSALKKITVKNADSVISSITPKTAEQNKPTVFTVKGSNLSSTLKLSVDGCKLPTQYSPSSTQVQMRCTPTLSGIKRGYVKDNGVVIKTFTVQIAPTASDDFYLTSTTLTASRLSAGSRVTARGYQRYNGTSGAYKKPYLGYYLSRDQVLDTSDKLLATDISYLKSTRRYNYESASLLIPSSTSTGQYYILFIADYKKNYAESNENNNVQAVSLTVTDSGGNKASVSSVAPVSAVYGRKTSFTVTGKNLPSTLAFWMSQCINVRKLSSTSTRVLFSCTPSYSAGSKSGIVKDKPGGKTLRSFRVNVTKSTQNSSDDFYVNSSRLSSSTVSSGRYIYGYTKQYYTGTKRTTQLRRPYPYVGYFLSKDSQWDSSDKRLAHDASSIGSNDRYDPESARLTIPSGTKAGRYYILFVADYKKSYAESNERNNLQSVFLTVR